MDNEVAAFTSFIHFPHPKVKNFKCVHRTVVYPDYQGIGLSRILNNYCSQLYKDSNFRVIVTTGHPILIGSMSRDKNWILKRKGRVSLNKKSSFSKTCSANRITTSWEFKGV